MAAARPSQRAIRHAWLTDAIRQIPVASRGVYRSRPILTELTLGRGMTVGGYTRIAADDMEILTARNRMNVSWNTYPIPVGMELRDIGEFESIRSYYFAANDFLQAAIGAARGIYSRGDDLQRVDIEARVRLIENRILRLEHEHLQWADASRGLETDGRREPARFWQEPPSPLGELWRDERQLR